MSHCIPSIITITVLTLSGDGVEPCQLPIARLYEIVFSWFHPIVFREGHHPLYQIDRPSTQLNHPSLEQAQPDIH